jgi:hypothetical protein
VKYIYLSGNEDVLRAKLGKGGVHIYKTNQAVLLGMYADGMQPSEAATVTGESPTASDWSSRSLST